MEEIIANIVPSGNNEHVAVSLIKECIGANRLLNFSYEHFSQWDGTLYDAERFGTECWKNGFEDVGYRFMAACITAVVLHHGKNRLNQ